MIIDIGRALADMYPKGTAKWAVIDGVLDWGDDTVPEPTQQELDEKIAELQLKYDSSQYSRSRSEEYPPMEEQLDMQYWDSINGTTVWLDTITGIKDKYPKE